MKFHYKGGSIYSYQYVVNGTTVVLGGPPTQSGLHLSAKVTIRFLTACDAILFVSFHSKEGQMPQPQLMKQKSIVSYFLPVFTLSMHTHS